MKRLISEFPQSFWDIIEFYEPNTLEDTIRKVMYFYEQFKNKTKSHKDQKKKITSRFKKKGFKPSIFKIYGKCCKMILPTKIVYHGNFLSHSGSKPFGEALGKTDNTKREPLKCWGCGEEHLLRDYPHGQQNSQRIYNVQENTTVNDVARSVP